jgi:hypothetical protein
MSRPTTSPVPRRAAPPSLTVELGRLARRQYGLVTTDQARAAGLTHRMVAELQRKGWLVPARRGVYRLCGVAPTWRSAALAAVLAAGGDAVLSHYSAAALWEICDPNDLEGRLELTASRLVRLEGVTTHRHALGARDRTVRHGIPVTTVERTLLDLSEYEPARRVGGALDEAVRRRLTTIGRFGQALERHERGPGRRRGRGDGRLGTARAVVAARGPDYDPGANDWELAMDRLWDESGLPPCPRQYTIEVPGGRRYRPDRVLVDARITVDWNGYAWHGPRSAFERDIERRNLLIAAGWTPLEFHSNQTREHICATVLQVYRERMSASLPAS